MGAWRKWITPLTIGSFVLMAVTGVLMFYHKDTGVNKLAHEWLSWLFLAAVALHVATHWISFKRYLVSVKALSVIGAIAAVLALSFYPWRGVKPEPPARTVMKVLRRATVAELAPIAHVTPAEAVAKLRAAGFSRAEAGKSPADIAGDGKKADTVLAALFKDGKAGNRRERLTAPVRDPG